MSTKYPFSTRLKMAGKSLAGLNFGDAAVALTNPSRLATSSYRGMAMGMNFGRSTWYTYSTIHSCVEAYTKCPPLAAVINKKARAHIRGRQTVISTTGQRKGKEATNEQAERLKKLLVKPNKLQTWNEFEAQVKIYQQLFGYCLILPIVPAGYDPIYATSVWVLPPPLCDIVERQTLFTDGADVNPIESITLTYGSEFTQLDPDTVYLIKDFTPSFVSMVIPGSKVRVLEQPINNIIGAYNSRGSIIDDRGALGMISSEKSDESGLVPLTKKEKEEVQDEFKNYGIKKGQFKYIITTAALKWTSIGYSTKDLMLFEEIEDDSMRICDEYGTPFRLMSNARNNSLGGSDAQEFNKQFYEDTIIPESDTLYDCFNIIFQTAKYGIQLVNDFSHLAILQADGLKTAQTGQALSNALQIDFRNNVITINEWRKEKGWEPLADENGNKYFSDLKALISSPVATQEPDNSTENREESDNSAKILSGVELLLKQYQR